MPFLPRVISFIRNILQKRECDRDLDDEVHSQLQLMIDEKVKRGMTPDKASRAAKIEMGGVEQLKEEVRGVRTGAWLDSLLQDVRFGLRMLRKSPGFTAVAVITLALGIGANTAIFSLIDALLLRSLPINNPQQVVMLQWSVNKLPSYHGLKTFKECSSRFLGDNPTGCAFSGPFFYQLRDQGHLFSGVAASAGEMPVDISGNGSASVAEGAIVSGNYFDVLGVRPQIGRLLVRSDDRSAAGPAAVLNYGYWQRAFGGSLSVLGKTISLNGVPTYIVGVAEQRFEGLAPGDHPDLWLPLSLQSRLSKTWKPSPDDPATGWLLILARLRPSVPRQSAEVAANLLFRDEMLHGAKAISKPEDNPRVSVLFAQSALVGARGTYSNELFVLMAAVGIVLLIAATNVAGLLLARSTKRQKEVAVRLALGAGRTRIVRQLLTESVLLSGIGGVLGLLLAVWGSAAATRVMVGGPSEALSFGASIDFRVLLFTAAVTFVSAVAFGVTPALRGASVDLTPSLKGDATALPNGLTRSQWFGIGNALVLCQVALTVTVLVGAGLLVRTLQNLRDINPGFDTKNLLNFDLNPELIGYQGPQLGALYQNIQTQLSAIPRVQSVGFSFTALLSGGLGQAGFHISGTPADAVVRSDYLPIGPDFFATMKMRILQGRGFRDSEYSAAFNSAATRGKSAATREAAKPAAPSAPDPVIINQTFARRYFKGADPLGQRFQTPHNPLGESLGFVVIGVVADAKYSSLRRDVQPTVYVRDDGTAGVSFEIRTTDDPRRVIPAVRSVVSHIDPNLPITNVVTESESIEQLLAQERSIGQLSSFFGALALALACVGLYGLLSYEVTRRAREIGIRMALGANRGNIMRAVVSRGFALVSAGLILGIVLSLGMTRLLGSILYNVHPGDPTTLIVVTLVLLSVCLVACYIPARRAMRVDPMVALRHE